ncbi:mannosylglucosylglycerate synthase [Marinitoga sp. 1138]|uniref:mannosylglucosylglycerate synthase n=1 Tax=Marinitoga sp. 1138 TaxID=1643334 RepID=UPI00158668A2|nr:mannosylglucosylglycerate synthase [Marinitoga sp. 1138]NUU98551.1 glycosyl transferase family 1 [Marinitoga sp. 1138]
MNMALLHYRGGLMDGVSLEMDKWKKVLEKLGHNADIVAGNKKEGVDNYIEDIGFENKLYRIINKNAFEKLEDFTEDELVKAIELESDKLLKNFEKGLEKYDVIFPNNIWSLGAFLPTAIALKRYADLHPEKLFIAHHHDFWWEREYFLNSTSKKIEKLLEYYCPPVGKNIKHMVINSIAKEELKKRKNVEATVVPNVMDFEEKSFIIEGLNKKIREYYDIPKNSIIFLQATRVTRRKAIELAIDLIEVFNKKVKDKKGEILYNGERFNGEILLAFSGMCEDDVYFDELKKKAKELNVKILDMYNAVEKGIWSFWDLYNISDIITYPSILEGWGNQLLEAIVAKKPVVLFEYEIFLSDIKNSGLEYINLGNEYEMIDGFVTVNREILEKAADELIEILFNKEKYYGIIERNFEVGKKYFSFDTLENIIRNLLK